MNDRTFDIERRTTFLCEKLICTFVKLRDYRYMLVGDLIVELKKELSFVDYRSTSYWKLIVPV